MTRWRQSVVSVVGFAWLVAPALAEDVVTIRTRDNQNTIRRIGTIEDFTGEKLTLIANGETADPIPFERVVSIATQWTEEQTSGDQFLAAGEIDRAIVAYKKAKEAEPRRWVVRMIQARLIEALHMAGRMEPAGEEFLELIDADPQTPEFGCIPLPWRSAAIADGIEAKARNWMARGGAPAALLGAAWLSSFDRPTATKKLETLAKDLDPRVAKLAEAQLWRQQRATAKAPDVKRWAARLDEMPIELRAGPQLIVGEVQLRLGQLDEGLITLWRPAILTPTRRAYAAEGLLVAGRAAAKAGRKQAAATAFEELLTSFSGSSRDSDAKQARATLGELQADGNP